MLEVEGLEPLGWQGPVGRETLPLTAGRGHYVPLEVEVEGERSSLVTHCWRWQFRVFHS